MVMTNYLNPYLTPSENQYWACLTACLGQTAGLVLIQSNDHAAFWTCRSWRVLIQVLTKTWKVQI